jgi:hypothetical protein
VYVHGLAPFSFIHATATDVSSPPENAIPTFSPCGRDAKTFPEVDAGEDMGEA